MMRKVAQCHNIRKGSSERVFSLSPRPAGFVRITLNRPFKPKTLVRAASALGVRGWAAQTLGDSIETVGRSAVETPLMSEAADVQPIEDCRGESSKPLGTRRRRSLGRHAYGADRVLGTVVRRGRNYFPLDPSELWSIGFTRDHIATT